jgi:uncharacterized damage-inducible protein DinB
MIEMTEDERAEPGFTAGEREMLAGWLDYHRATLVRKCAGLTDAQMRMRSCEPSTLSLLGLVRHLTEVEHSWLADFDGRRRPPLYFGPGNDDGDFDDIAEADVQACVAEFHAEIELSRQTYANHDLDAVFTTKRGEQFSMRWVITHLIEEYARHNGHADMLRQRIDGAIGA